MVIGAHGYICWTCACNKTLNFTKKLEFESAIEIRHRRPVSVQRSEIYM
jgi:hypothetical protein